MARGGADVLCRTGRSSLDIRKPSGPWKLVRRPEIDGETGFDEEPGCPW